MLQILLEANVEGLIGAGRHRAQRRPAQLSRWLARPHLETPLETLSLRIPKLRQGSYFPPFLEPRKTGSRNSTLAYLPDAHLSLTAEFPSRPRTLASFLSR